MTFVSILETFGAVVVAFGGFEGVKWVIRRYAPKKNEKRLDESEATKSEVEVQQAVQDIQKTILDMDSARIRELREANAVVNKTNVDLTNQITDLLKAGARKDEIISDKTSKIRDLEDEKIALIREYEEKITAIEKEHKDAMLSLQKEYEEKITELMRQLGHQEKLTMFYRAWHCEREYGRKKENCLRRKPAQEPPLKYCPPEIVATQIVETDPLLIPECENCQPKAKTAKSKH